MSAIVDAKPLKEDPKDDDLRKLLKARYNEALVAVQGLYQRGADGQVYACEVYDPDAFYHPWHRLVTSGLEVVDTQAERVALLAHQVEAMKAEEKETQLKFDVGRAVAAPLHRARYERLDAEIKLLRAKREADKPKDK
jgi:hypothetical protein